MRSSFLKLFVGNSLLVGAVAAIAWWSTTAAVLAGAAMAAVAAWLWSRRLWQMTLHARQIASGGVADAVRIRGSDMSQLASALDEMRQSAARQIALAEARRQNLQTIVDNLREAVLATDAHGRVVLANHAAVNLLCAHGQPQGSHVSQAVRFLEVIDLFNQAPQAGGSCGSQVEVELRGQRRLLDVYAVRMSAHGGDGIAALILARDITDAARAAAMKADFVANASHELRTPLATLRAAVDSLSFIEPDDSESFAKVAGMLDRHVARLENMTRDLLDLHVVESGRAALRIEEMSLATMVQWAKDSFQGRADSRGVRFLVEAKDFSRVFGCDRTLLELILQNLIDNAIKFTPPGGTVRCQFEPAAGASATGGVAAGASPAVAPGAERSAEAGGDTGGEIIVRVTDTGCGIPSESRSKVFERFFQVDAARSGDPRFRGTGLGLAIVKHACDRLGARLDLQSELGVGTTVTVSLPSRAET